MKKGYHCPSCENGLSRWGVLEPFPGFLNRCGQCGKYFQFKNWKYRLVFFEGILISLAVILGLKGLLSWTLGVPLVAAFILATEMLLYFFSPLKASPREAPHPFYWVAPFFKYQMILLFIALLGFIIFSPVTKKMVLNTIEEDNLLFWVDSALKKSTDLTEIKGIAETERGLLVRLIDMIKNGMNLAWILFFLMMVQVFWSGIFLYFKTRSHVRKE